MSIDAAYLKDDEREWLDLSMHDEGSGAVATRSFLVRLAEARKWAITLDSSLLEISGLASNGIEAMNKAGAFVEVEDYEMAKAFVRDALENSDEYRKYARE